MFNYSNGLWISDILCMFAPWDSGEALPRCSVLVMSRHKLQAVVMFVDNGKEGTLESEYAGLHAELSTKVLCKTGWFRIKGPAGLTVYAIYTKGRVVQSPATPGYTC